MDWIKAKNIVLTLFLVLFAKLSFAQEALWKTFNGESLQTVPAYNGGLSPFPQKQKEVEEVAFQQIDSIEDLVIIDNDDSLTDEEKKKMKTTSLLAEIKEFLATEEVFLPNLRGVIIEAIAKNDGKYKALIFGRWLTIGDVLKVPVTEAQKALELLEGLKDVDSDLAETVEEAVMERTQGKGQELITITEIEDDKVIFSGNADNRYEISFIRAPF